MTFLHLTTTNFLSKIKNREINEFHHIFSFSITTYTTDNKLNECAVSCVKAYTVCRSFVFTATSSLCQLYNTTLVNGNITRSGVSYYRAIPEQVC